MTIDRKEIWRLWSTCHPDLSRTDEIVRASLNILGNWMRYRIVAEALKMPAYVVGLIHYRESSFNFKTHLANGDPLFNSANEPIATTHFPDGLGPFKTWEDASIAALLRAEMDRIVTWDIISTLIKLERYNGMGSRRHAINSPYVWAATNHYKAGKYAADHVWDQNLVDKQLGCAVILLALKAHGVDLLEITPV